MNDVEAIFRHGVFQPLHPVILEEEQRVRLSIEPVVSKPSDAWFERVRERQATIARRQGLLPDSAVEIAEDRTR